MAMSTAAHTVRPPLASGPVPPAPAARAAERLLHALERLQRRLLPANAAMLELITRRQITTRAITAAVALGIPEALAGGPLDAGGLAAATATRVDPLERLMRALAAEGVVKHGRRGYALTRLGRALCDDAPG